MKNKTVKNVSKMSLAAIFIFVLGFIGLGAVNAFGEGSKYDSQVSKYDISENSFNYSYPEGSVGCEKISFKEKEAIMADIKTGRFHIKLEPGMKGVYHLSNDFSTQKEFVYFADSYTCTKYFRKEIMEVFNATKN